MKLQKVINNLIQIIENKIFDLIKGKKCPEDKALIQWDCDFIKEEQNIWDSHYFCHVIPCAIRTLQEFLYVI